MGLGGNNIDGLNGKSTDRKKNMTPVKKHYFLALHMHRALRRRPWHSNSPNKETINHVCERLSKCLLSGQQQGSGIYLAQGNVAIQAASQAVSQSFHHPAS